MRLLRKEGARRPAREESHLSKTLHLPYVPAGLRVSPHRLIFFWHTTVLTCIFSRRDVLVRHLKTKHGEDVVGTSKVSRSFINIV